MRRHVILIVAGLLLSSSSVGIEDTAFGVITVSPPTPQDVGTSVTFSGTITDLGPFPTPWPASSLSVTVDGGSPISVSIPLSATSTGSFSIAFNGSPVPLLPVGAHTIAFNWADDGIRKATSTSVPYTITADGLPTMPQWMLIVLAAMIALAATYHLRRSSAPA